MKKNNLAVDYARYEDIKAQFDAAETEEDKAVARETYGALMADIATKGKDYMWVFRLYDDAKAKGNEYIDLHDALQDEQVEGLINSLRKNGIEKFTFSSTWSSAVKTAWLIQKNGCTLEGLVEINSAHPDSFNSEYEKVPGYLFCIH
jgi:hypothetical protein